MLWTNSKSMQEQGLGGCNRTRSARIRAAATKASRANGDVGRGGMLPENDSDRYTPVTAISERPSLSKLPSALLTTQSPVVNSVMFAQLTGSIGRGQLLCLQPA
jgi:hypothetical protein